jgi:pilus assembly protein CpaF
MFTIVISEKGGAERRETFVQGEVTVGRAQGVDLRLDKGNVSKQHAKLAFKDGRFIVSDLKSTNGTWVNGKKIASATILREGDKVYVGDFVLRVEAGSDASGAPIPIDLASGEAVPVETPSRQHEPPSFVNRVPSAPPPPVPGVVPPPYSPPPFDLEPPRRATARPLPPTALASPPVPPVVPAPVPVARGATVMLGNAPPIPSPPLPPPPVVHATLPPAPPIAAPLPPPPAVPHVPAPPPVAKAPSAPPPAPAASEGRATRARVPSRSVTVPPPRGPETVRPDAPESGGSPAAVALVVERAFDVVGRAALREGRPLDETARRRLEQAVKEQTTRVRAEDPSVIGPDFEAHAILEALEGGALGALLRDESVIEILGSAAQALTALRQDGSLHEAAPTASDSALLYALRRLAAEGGLPWPEGVGSFEGTLRDGSTLTAVAAPLAAATTFSIAKRRWHAGDLGAFAQATGLGRGFGELASACVHARANVLVSAPSAAEGARLLAAFAAEFPRERVLVAGEADLPDLRGLRDVVFVPATDDRVMQTALRFRVDRALVTPLAGASVAPVLEAITSGARGVLAVVVAPSLRQALARTSAQLVTANPGLTGEAAREIVAEAFDVAVEIADVLSAQARITRIAEVAGADSKQVLTRDLFSAVDFGGADTSLAATGVVPRFLQEFAARGVRLDSSLFRRSG